MEFSGIKVAATVNEIRASSGFLSASESSPWMQWIQALLRPPLKREKTSLMFVYAWRDENHFNYAHLSVDAPAKQPVHNGIFHVYGGDRVRISSETGPGALPNEDWTPVKLTWSAKTGEVQVEVNGKRFENLHAVDLSLGAGRVGLGSFFETAQFRKVRIHGTAAAEGFAR